MRLSEIAEFIDEHNQDCCMYYNNNVVKGCQKWLKVLKEDYKNKYHDIVVPKGTILYMDYPVESTSNKADWTYEIKTTASCLGGDFATTENMLNTILNIMKNKVSSWS